MSKVRLLPYCFSLAVLAGNHAPAHADLQMAKPSFLVFHELGRFENALSENVLPIKDQWVHRTGAWLDMKAGSGDRLTLDMRIGGIYYTPTLEEADRQSKVRFFAASVPRLAVGYKFGNPESPFLRIDGGVFHYKYNAHARNLGEYMFRTGIYPGWIQTGGLTYVGVNNAQLTGVKAGQNFGTLFSHDLILNLETEILPIYDVHLSYLAKLNFSDILTVGAGIQLARILPAVPSKTNPNVADNRYFEYQGKTYVDQSDYYQTLIEGVQTRAKPYREQLAALAASSPAPADSAQRTAQLTASLNSILADTLIHAQALEILAGIKAGTIKAPAYSHFKASGFKPVVHFSFDPKPLLGLDLFGPNDLILYGEAAVLGVQDYPVLYPNIKERAPVMLGFNVPTFKLLDVLSLEMEYYASKLPNSIRETQNKAQPQPTLPPIGGYIPEDWDKDDWKWSLFAQRSFGPGFALSGQVARDHARGFQFPTGKTDWSLLSEKKHWYWMVKFAVNI